METRKDLYELGILITSLIGANKIWNWEIWGGLKFSVFIRAFILGVDMG